MKKQLFFLALAGLFTTAASATDLYVREAGAGGAYSTISAAVAAAANGDRIIIKPKAGTAAYVENLAISKSLTFVSETNYAKYLVQGTITITPAPQRVVTFNNLSLTPYGNIYTNYNITISGGTVGGRTTLNIYNSVVNEVNANTANTTLNMSGSAGAGVKLSHGRCTGNKVEALSVFTSTDTALAATDVELIANAVQYSIYNEQISYAVKICNNFTTAIYIYGFKANSVNEITNNAIYNPEATDQAPITVNLPAANGAQAIIMNNAISFAAPYNPEMIQCNNVTASASYNKSTNAFVATGVTTLSNNTGSVSMAFSATAYTVTGANVNAGNPADEFRDLDLTINDIANYGGSNSWANYWPANAANKPQVNYLITPRAISSGTSTMSVSGSGFSK